MTVPGLALSHVTKRFGDVTVLDDVSCALAPRRIHAIIGENGAGKSTAVKLFAGLLAADAGTVEVLGSSLVPANPREAGRRGVGLVHQHFSLVPSFTVLENLLLGHEPVGRLGFIRAEEQRAAAEALMARTGLVVSLDAVVGSLGVGAKQRVEIVRVLLRGARAVLLDEPTAILLPKEVTALYELLRALADDGAIVGVVTHYLDEVMAHADDVTVLRRGKQIYSGPVSDRTREALSLAALGEVEGPPARPPLPEGAAVLLEVAGLSGRVEGPGGASGQLADVSLSVRAGEIVGVAGIDGNGQDAFVLALAGLGQITAGSVRLGSVDITHAAVSARRAQGLEVIHGERHRWGMVANASVGDNLVLGELGHSLAQGDAEREERARRLERSGARPAEEGAPMRSLSGGNQQKIVTERALSQRPKVLVASYPTRGVDAAAAAHLRARLVSLAKDGAAVVIVSADLEELRQSCHRLVVFVKGRVAARLEADATVAELAAAMLSGGTA